MDIFGNINKNTLMLEGAYKKLKAFLYHDKTLIFTKQRLAVFESNRESFLEKLNELAFRLAKNDMVYFENFMEEISFKVVPKSFKSETNCSEIKYGVTDHNQKVNKINFLIDMPIELFILDCLWTILIGKIYNECKFTIKASAATSFKKSLYNKNYDLLEGVDWESNRMFEPYYSLYTSWRDGAFEAIQNCSLKEDVVLMCLDLKSFYYSVDFKFCDLLTMLDNDDRLMNLQFLTNVIEKIYKKYTNIIVDYKKGIRKSKIEYIFPIGLLSTFVLREIYLKRFDENIFYALDPIYYSRYVDDILLVMRTTDDFRDKNEVIKRCLIKNKLVVKSKDDELKFVDYNNLRIQDDKINCFMFPKYQDNVLLEVYKESIKKNSSENNLLPDSEILYSTFTYNAYNIQNLDMSNKIRDLGLLKNNNFRATKYITALQQLIKNTKMNKSSDIQKYLEQVEEVYSGSKSIEFSNNWKLIFEVFLLCGELNRAKTFYYSVLEEIRAMDLSNISNDEVLEKKKKYLLDNLKDTLIKKLKISFALACALKNDFLKSDEVKELSTCFRKANMFNHSIVTYPLINYFGSDNFPLINTTVEDLCKANCVYFDDFKIKYSPRFIKSIEIYIITFLISKIRKENTENYLDEVYNKYLMFNNIQEIKSILPYKVFNDNHYNVAQRIIDVIPVNYDINKNKKCRISVLNTKVTEEYVYNTICSPSKELTIEKKIKVFKVLNRAKEDKSNIIVFPEFYFPVEWLMDITQFVITNNITVITGLRYIFSGNIAYNNVCCIVPIAGGFNFYTSIFLFREKNFYAPEEKKLLNKLGYKCHDGKVPFYFVLDNIMYRFSVILCYEFTDIVSRASMKSLIEILFVPQLNMDTNYFSAIVEASARDLHCFIVQANTSLYGDSRITAPYRTVDKNILRIKGGDTDTLLTSDVNVWELKQHREKFGKAFAEEVQKCCSCENIKGKEFNDMKEMCKSCKQKRLKHKDDKIKGTPPNFIE